MDINPSSEPRRRERRRKRPDMVKWNKRDRAPVQGMDASSATDFYWSRAAGDEPFPTDFEAWTPTLAYLRVSTDDQVDRYGPEVQRDAMARYARSNRLRIVDEFYDSDSGDLPLSARPEGMALLQAFKSHKARVILTLCLDRLARNEADAHQSWQSFRYARIDLHFAKRGKQEANLAGRMIFSIEASMAAAERELIRERTTNGRDRKAREGKWVGVSLPYGYRRGVQGDEHVLVPDPQTTQIVSQIFEWYVLGDEQGLGLSISQIARRLKAAGVKRPGAYKAGDPASCEWNEASVRYILMNRTYAGVYEHGKQIILPKEYDTQEVSERRAYRPEDQIIRVQLPQSCVIVPPPIWDAAQRRLAHNRDMANRKRAVANGVYLLSGYLVCAHCGHNMRGVTRKLESGHIHFENTPLIKRYYRCNDKKHTCSAWTTSMRVELIDPFIVQLLRAELAEERLDANLEALHQQRSGSAELTRERVADLRKMLKEEQRSLDRVVDRLSRTDDAVQIEALNRGMAEHARLIAQYRAKLSQAELTLEEIDLTPKREQEIRQLAVAIRRRLDAAKEQAQLRTILTALQVQITLDVLADPYSLTLKWSLGPELTYTRAHPKRIDAATVGCAEEDHWTMTWAAPTSRSASTRRLAPPPRRWTGCIPRLRAIIA